MVGDNLALSLKHDLNIYFQNPKFVFAYAVLQLAAGSLLRVEKEGEEVQSGDGLYQTAAAGLRSCGLRLQRGNNTTTIV